MRGVKAETWKRYYTKHTREKELRKRRDEPLNGVGEPLKVPGDRVNADCDRVKVPRDRVNDRVNSIRDRVNGVGDRVNSEDEKGDEDRLFEVIKENPGQRSKALSLLISRSVPTVSRYLKLLKVAKKVEFRGAPKTGGYYVCAFNSNSRSEGTGMCH
jgi:hypothetical protein